MDYFECPAYERVEKMFLCRQLGMPLKLIGQRFDVTGHRVSQILEKRQQELNRLEMHQDRRQAEFMGELLGSQYNPRTHAVKAALILQAIG